MGLKKTPTEGGSGGKRGHSNMDHWAYTEEIKDAARTQRRIEDRKAIHEAGAQSDRATDRVEWWLMDCLPDLNWARLTVRPNGSAQVFDCDGATHQFPTELDARNFLLEDEFRPWTSFDASDFTGENLTIDQVHPPEGADDEVLLPQMLQRAPDRGDVRRRPTSR